MAKGVNSTIIVGECNGASVVAVVRRRVLAIAATLRSTEHGERHAISAYSDLISTTGGTPLINRWLHE